MTTALTSLTVLVVVAALTAIALAARVIVRERRRSEARIAYLAGRIQTARVPSGDEAGETVPVQGLFSEPVDRARPTWLPLATAIAAAIVVVLVLTMLRGSDNATRAVPAASAVPREAPLELVALRDERSSDQLTIHGVVRNPARGAEIDHIIAVVLVFNEQGGFLTSGRAALDISALAPGGESAFAVSIPGAATVGRYRVSFRDDARVIPHVDRRQT